MSAESPSTNSAPAFEAPTGQMYGTTLTEAYANPELPLSNLDRAVAQHNIEQEKGFVNALADVDLQQNILKAESLLNPDEKKALQQKLVAQAAVNSVVGKPEYVKTSAQDQAAIDAAGGRDPSKAAGYDAYDKVLAENEAYAAKYEANEAARSAGKTWAEIQTPGKNAVGPVADLYNIDRIRQVSKEN